MVPKRATLKDVAERSGYALRTVKNVVAGKSTVGGPVRDAVLKAMEELNYKQNALASALVKNKTYLVAVILPQTNTVYQEELEAGILKCAERYEDFGLYLEWHHTPPDPQAQIRLLEEFYEREDVCGILLQPTHERLMNQQIDLLVYNNKPVITLDTDAPDSKRSCFVGADQIRCGRVAAQLMANYLGRKGTVLAVYREHRNRRLDGFLSMMQERFPDITAEPWCLQEQGFPDLQQTAIQGIFDCGNNLQELGQLLQTHNTHRIVLIGNQLTEQTTAWMEEGLIDLIIGPDANRTGRIAMDLLFRYLSRQEALPKNKEMPPRICTSECL